VTITSGWVLGRGLKSFPEDVDNSSMIKRNLLIPALVFVALLLIGLAVYKFAQRHGLGNGGINQELPPIGNNLPCPGETITRSMEDPYMRGIIEQGQKYRVIMNYYACNPIRKGDYVLHRLSSTLEPTVKIVEGVPGDRFSLVKDKEHNAWNVVVNDDMVKRNGKPYFFGAPTAPTMSLYEKAQKGLLQKGDIILLSSWPPGDRDSGIFGVMSVQDVLGKVEPLDSESKSEPAPESSPSQETASEASPTPTKVQKHRHK